MTQDVNFNSSYGDIEIIGDDLELLRDNNRARYQMLLQLFKTNYGDYELSPKFGLDLDRYIGQGVTEGLALRIRQVILDGLIKTRVITVSSDAEILYSINRDVIFYRIKIGTIKLDVAFIKGEGFAVE